MPYAAPVELDENDPRKNPSGGVNISGQSGTVSTNVPGQDSSGDNQKSSGQYTNIQSYLDANKQQGDDMGTKVAGDVSAKADDAQQKIQGYESKAPTVAAYDPNDALGRVTDLNDDEKNTYKTTKATGGYTGPVDQSGVDGYFDANKAGTEAVTAVQNAGNEVGQRELLKSSYARPDYNAGQNNLDQAILQGSAGSKSKLEELGTKYSGLSNALTTANTNVGTAVNAANAQALANKQAFAPAETNAWNALVNPIQQRADQANLDNPEVIKRVQDDVSDNILSEDTLQRLGLSTGSRIFDLDLRNYVNPNQSQVGLDNVANTDERAKYAALQSLLDDPTRTQITATGKTIDPVSLNRAQFDKDLAGKQAEFDRYSASTNVLGQSDQLHADDIDQKYWKNDPDWASATTQQILADALAGKQAGTSYQHGLPAYGMVQRDGEAAAQSQQRYQALLAQLLDAQNYNRTIQKG
jgi:hypothetical protein